MLKALMEKRQHAKQTVIVNREMEILRKINKQKSTTL